MDLRLVYRSYGGDNAKVRPSWFDKELAAASFTRAAEHAGIAPLWLNDGPIPSQIGQLQQRVGTIVNIPGGPVGMRRSYLTALRLAIDSNWPEDDVVYFCEDDYLHTADAFTILRGAARELPQVSYFALYGSTPRYASPEWPGGYTFPDDWPPAPALHGGGHRWINVASTASTFGVRVGALRQDYCLFRQAMVPFRRRYLDHETCLLYQGFRPYRGRELVLGLRGDFIPGPRGVARAVFLVPFRLGLNMRARRNSTDPHLLYAAEPNLGCHMETDVMTPGRDWSAVAGGVKSWARAGRVSREAV